MPPTPEGQELVVYRCPECGNLGNESFHVHVIGCKGDFERIVCIPLDDPALLDLIESAKELEFAPNDGKLDDLRDSRVAFTAKHGEPEGGNDG